MPGPTTEILNDDLKSLRSDVQRIEVGLAEIRTELRVIIGIGKVLLVAMLTGIGTSIWWAGTITAEVKNLAARTGQLQGEVSGLRSSGDTPKRP